MKIFAFAGSTRKASFNKRLLVLVAEALTAAGHEVSVADLSDYAMPLYNGDDEEANGVPEAATRLKARLAPAEALLIATPEYNGFFPPLVKNTLDWMSRPVEGAEARAAFLGKKAIVVSASPSPYGGQRAQVQLRELLTNLGTELVEATVSAAKAHESLGAEPAAETKKAIAKLVAALA